MSTVALAGRDLLDLESLTRAEIEHILDTAETFGEVLTRDVKKVPTLRGKSVVTLFYENSTRTRSSFEAAGKYMSAGRHQHQRLDLVGDQG